MRAHEALGIKLEILGFKQDFEIRKAYEKKLQELNSIKVIELGEYERRKKELDEALDLLRTQAKRNEYKRKMNSPEVALNTINTPEGFSSFSVTLSPAEQDKQIRTYQSYVEMKIQNLDQDDQNNDERKKALEVHKKTAELTVANYATYDCFQNSQYYQCLSAKEKQTYSEDNFPTTTTIVTLTFDNWEEAVNYTKENNGIEAARELVKQIRDKKYQLDTKVEEEINRGETHYARAKMY